MTLQLQQDFRAEVLGITEVQNEIGARVFPLLIPSDMELPAMSYRFDDGTADSFYRDSFGLTTHAIQLDLYTRNPTTQINITQAIQTHFHGQTLSLNGNTQVDRSVVTNILNSLDPDDNQVFRTTIQITFQVGG